MSVKTFLLIGATFLTTSLIAQTPEENKILQLSNQIFHWETENKIDSLENVLDVKFVVVNSNGESQTKQQYISKLKSGNFIHNKIDIEQNTAIVENNSATVIGKGKFAVTISGNKTLIHLSYIEVFTRDNSSTAWKLLALQANKLQD